MESIRHVRNGYPVIRPGFARLDAGNAANLKQLCVREAVGKRMLLELDHIELIDSTGLGALVSVLKHLGMDGEVGIFSNCPGLLIVLRITRLNSIFRMFSTASEAIEWLESFPPPDPAE